MSLVRKVRKLYQDPTLRLWVWGRLQGKWSYPKISRQLPSYLERTKLPRENGINSDLFSERHFSNPISPANYNFAGEDHKIYTDSYNAIDENYFSDPESKRSFHRFSWIHAAGRHLDPDWVGALWTVWVKKYSNNTHSSLAWQPYTVGERLINILYFSTKFGMPGPKNATEELLQKHGRIIFENLEYFGESYTGNHLANNGRALYLGGLMLGIKSWTDIGSRILLEEANRIFCKSGELREGSVHYHLLTCKWYLECWLTAKKYGHKEVDSLKKISSSVLSVLPIFDMPAGLPLIGDISPDCSPSYLKCLMDNSITGWFKELSVGEQAAVSDLIKSINEDGETVKVLNSWCRTDVGPWSAIWHSTVNGWQPMPGHGHQDFGGFELHHNEARVFVDLGRRSYSDSGDIDKETSAHNTLTIDDLDPYPENKLYYTDDFREFITGIRPSWEYNRDSIKLETSCFSRIDGVGRWCRSWHFKHDEVLISDTIEGTGHHKILRYLHTTYLAKMMEGGVTFGPFNISSSSKISVESTKYWKSYGKNENATAIIFSDMISLPTTLSLKVSFKGIM